MAHVLSQVLLLVIIFKWKLVFVSGRTSYTFFGLQVVCPYCALCFGKCYSGGSTLIQTSEILEGVRKLVSTQTSYSKDIRNGNRTSSLDHIVLRHKPTPLGVTSDVAKESGEDTNGNGNGTENGGQGTLLEDSVQDHSAGVDEPQEPEISDPNLSTGNQVPESS